LDPAAAAKHLTPDSRAVLASLLETLREISPWAREGLHATIQAAAEQAGVGLGRVAQPLRVAVTGSTISPPIDQTLELLGRERVIRRLEKALSP
jgi:glutamyl-tRNA synthetase